MSEQMWDPGHYARHARFVTDLGAPLLDLLAARPGERILDLGCGDGVLTEKIAAIGCRVVGVDSSPRQVEAARSRGLDARVMDGQRLMFDQEFDAVFSNAALHWMKDADAVIDGVWRALRPGGRFVAEMGGAGNVAAIERALLGGLARRGLDGRTVYPWYYPTPEEYRARLEAQGFVVSSVSLFARPTPLPGDITDWLDVFAQPFIALVRPAERVAFITEVRERLRPALCDTTGRWIADYVRLRFLAVRPGVAGG